MHCEGHEGIDVSNEDEYNRLCLDSFEKKFDTFTKPQIIGPLHTEYKKSLKTTKEKNNKERKKYKVVPQAKAKRFRVDNKNLYTPTTSEQWRNSSFCDDNFEREYGFEQPKPKPKNSIQV